MTAAEVRFYNLTAEEAAAELQTDLSSGLSPAEAKERLAKYGPNQLREKKGISPLEIFIDQFKDFIVWVLIGAALVSGVLREWVDALAIVAIIFLNAVLGFVQEFRAEKSLAALKKLSSPTSKVIRDGQKSVIPAAELVPGDLIELEAGDLAPADGRLIYASPNFSAQEASLTGESTPVIKTSHPLVEKEVPLADRVNMVYLGTSISSGKGRALIAGTGMNTELGRIAGMIQEIEEMTTPLQKKLEEFGKWIVYLCFGLVAMVFLMEIYRGGEMLEIFLTAVSLAVAAIPEGLPAVVTIALALGVQRMVGRHVLIRRLPSVETLGSATVICSDKTGTLTKNEMTVKTVYAGGRFFQVTGVGYEPHGNFLLDDRPVNPNDFPALRQTLLGGVLCNGAELKENGIVGDPTEGALLVAAAKAGRFKEELEKEYPFLEEIPFDPDRKKMTILRKKDGVIYAFVKGAPEVILRDCPDVENREEVLKANTELASQAMRVLAVAYRVFDGLPEKIEPAAIEKELAFAGLIAMIDPPREEVKTAVARCKTAGIKVIMITGDHRSTAEAIGRELGIDNVHARVAPEDKIRIVKDLRARGEIVAMTGDGVNDAPAVKEADIGVAMGITGTDVTKEVSDMVITDDNFASIVAAVEEGRGIYGNIKKFVHYLLSCNAGEILVMFTASLLGMPVPLLPVQILWVNLVTDGFPALALGVDPVSPGIMNQPPRPTNERVVTGRQMLLMLFQGVFIAFCSLLAFVYVLYIENEGISRAQTAAFIVLSVSQLFHSFNCRSQKISLFKLGIVTNMNLIYAFILSFGLQMAVVYLPFFQGVFRTEPLSGADWLMIIFIASLPLWAMELIKIVNRKLDLIKE